MLDCRMETLKIRWQIVIMKLMIQMSQRDNIKAAATTVIVVIETQKESVIEKGLAMMRNIMKIIMIIHHHLRMIDEVEIEREIHHLIMISMMISMKRN